MAARDLGQGERGALDADGAPPRSAGQAHAWQEHGAVLPSILPSTAPPPRSEVGAAQLVGTVVAPEAEAQHRYAHEPIHHHFDVLQQAAFVHAEGVTQQEHDPRHEHETGAVTDAPAGAQPEGLEPPIDSDGDKRAHVVGTGERVHDPHGRA